MNWMLNVGKEIPVRKDLPPVFNKVQACAFYKQNPFMLEEFKIHANENYAKNENQNESIFL